MSELEDGKLTKELLDEVRSLDGFPIANDEDIIAISDPPLYTACPNPFIKNFINKYGKPYDPENDHYKKEPFTADVSEGKNDPIYIAHTYHTKVPHKAVMRYILHYTDPGDIVFDGFCGTGMTGVAAQLCGNPDRTLKINIEKEMPYIQWGPRGAILNELSPAATFISYNLTNSVNIEEFLNEANKLINKIQKKYEWFYHTEHSINKIRDIIKLNNVPIKGIINYVVWSDVYICPGCSKEFVFYNVALDKDNKKIKDEFHCPNCDALLSKRNIDRVYEVFMDDALGKTIKRAKQVPILINYKMYNNRGVKRYNKKLDKNDLELIKKIEEEKIPYWHPINEIPDGDKTGEPHRIGITHVHHYYTKRNLRILAAIYDEIKISKFRNQLLFVFQSFCATLSSKLSRYNLGKRGNGPLSGTLYIASLTAEANVIEHFKAKLNYISKALRNDCYPCITSCSSSTNLSNIPSNSIDYIFTDPPFGGNLMYSELNHLWESWLKILTNSKDEAIVNRTQGKKLPEYQTLMERCFRENYRILKPGRWMTVEFHNSQNRVWIAIQEALLRAGFVVADVRTLDKKQGTFNQVLSSSRSVKQDLIISAYKPNEGLEVNFMLKGGTIEGVWAFIRHHLTQLPIYVEKEGNVEIIAERQSFLLFDRMVAFHVQRGLSVPISAGDFYGGLKQRFPLRDDMYFTVYQVHEYDRKRMKAKHVEQVSLFVHDERSAIQWLRRELSREPQTYQDIQPTFLQELYKEKHEDLPELSEILEQNFLQCDEGRWYIPDSSREADLEKLREKTLLREFQEYKDAKGRLRIFRSEAVRIGFSKCWQEGDYGTIVEVAEKLPTRVLQEEPTLLMYYDNAVMRTQE